MTDVQLGDDVVEGEHERDEQESAGDNDADFRQDVLHDVESQIQVVGDFGILGGKKKTRLVGLFSFLIDW